MLGGDKQQQGSVETMVPASPRRNENSCTGSERRRYDYRRCIQRMEGTRPASTRLQNFSMYKERDCSQSKEIEEETRGHSQIQPRCPVICTGPWPRSRKGSTVVPCRRSGSCSACQLVRTGGSVVKMMRRQAIMHSLVQSMGAYSGRRGPRPRDQWLS